MNKFLGISAIAGLLFASSLAFAHEPQIGIHVAVPNVIFQAHSYQPYYYQHHHYRHAHHHYYRHPAYQNWRHHGAAKHHWDRPWDGYRGDQNRDGHRHGR